MELIYMAANKTFEGRYNICGRMISIKRMEMKKSQRMLAEDLERAGLVMDKNAIQKIEAGTRYVSDIELKVISNVLGLSLAELLTPPPSEEKEQTDCIS